MSVITADVSNVLQVRQVIEEVYARFGALHGVFHAAGVTRQNRTGFASLAEADDVNIELHFGPKVYGLYALEEALPPGSRPHPVSAQFLARTLLSWADSATVLLPPQVVL